MSHCVLMLEFPVCSNPEIVCVFWQKHQFLGLGVTSLQFACTRYTYSKNLIIINIIRVDCFFYTKMQPICTLMQTGFFADKYTSCKLQTTVEKAVNGLIILPEKRKNTGRSIRQFSEYCGEKEMICEGCLR